MAVDSFGIIYMGCQNGNTLYVEVLECFLLVQSQPYYKWIFPLVLESFGIADRKQRQIYLPYYYKFISGF
jgi:hypothetical protein